LILRFFGSNIGTRNAKNLFGPFKFPNSNQKTAKLKKIFMSFKWLLRVLTVWRLAAFGDFAREYLRSCSGYGPGRSVKRRGKSSSLHSKKIFCLGVAGFL